MARRRRVTPAPREPKPGRFAWFTPVWRFVAGTVAAAAIGTPVTIYVTKALDGDDPNPIAVNVVGNPATVEAWASTQFRVVLPPDARPAEPPPGDCPGIVDWAHRQGGIDQDDTRVRFSVQGLADQGILIDKLWAHVVRRSATPEPAGVEIRCGGPQGVTQLRDVVMDLDAQRPAAVYAQKVEGRLPLFGFTLQKGETEVFQLEASTTGTVEWLLELELVVAGERRNVKVSNHGAPFRTTAWQPSRRYQVEPGTDYWSECVNDVCRENVSPATFRYTP